MCTFSSFVDFPFIFWRVSCEGVFLFFFSPFLILIFALGAKVSFGQSGYIPCRQGRRFHPKRPSESRAMRDP